MNLYQSYSLHLYISPFSGTHTFDGIHNVATCRADGCIDVSGLKILCSLILWVGYDTYLFRFGGDSDHGVIDVRLIIGGIGQQTEKIGLSRIGDPHLATINHIIIAVFFGVSFNRRNVRSCMCFTDRKTHFYSPNNYVTKRSNSAKPTLCTGQSRTVQTKYFKMVSFYCKLQH